MNAAPDRSVIEEVALELGIDPAFVEKDWYVVQLIRVITETDLFGAHAIFTGGTALAKAHRLLQRFSEDIDFRLILPEQTSLSRSAQRRLLSKIRNHVQEVITQLFPPNAVKSKSRDENRFFSIEVKYPSVVDPSQALRPHVLLEFTVSTLALGPKQLPVVSFIAELTKTGPEIPAVDCIDPVENAVDKLSALIWRVPDRTRVPEDDDPDLTRHIHDLAALQPYATAHAHFRRLAIEMIHRDDDRCDKIAGLPMQEKIRILMNILTTDAAYRTEYIRFVLGMSYAAGEVPDYDEAIAKLKLLVDHLM